MFRGQQFYHQHIRNVIIVFGMLFNNLHIKRKNANEDTVQLIKVPLNYGPKQKTIARIAAAPELETGRTAFEIVTPRMGFEITSLVYDSARKLPPMKTIRAIGDDNSVRQTFVATPYNMGVSMSVFAKNQDDGMQVVEQILPYFNPDFSVTINEIPELGVVRDIQFVLDGVNYNDNYEGLMSERIKFIWDLAFTIKMNFYGYVADVSLINKVITSIFASTFTEGNPNNLGYGTRIITTPNPANADPSGDYEYLQQFDQVLDYGTPTTLAPTTTTVAPTTAAPTTTQAPTTIAPTTLAPTTAAPTTTPPPSDPPMTGLIHWYRSDTVVKDGGDQVTSWTDLVGVAHATIPLGTTGPTWLAATDEPAQVPVIAQSLPVLHFSPPNNRLLAPVGNLGITNGNELIVVAHLNAASSGVNSLFATVDSLATRHNFYPYPPDVFTDSSLTAVEQTMRVGTLPSDEHFLQVFSIGRTTTRITHRQGNSSGLTILSTNNLASPTYTDLTAGGISMGFSASGQSNSYWYEYFVYDHELTESEREILLAYLATRYGAF